MFISLTMIAFVLWLSAIHPSTATIIDSFSQQGKRNNIKQKRAYTKHCQFKNDGLLITTDGSLTEFLAPLKSSMDLTGKSFQFVYSTSNRRPCQISVRNKGQQGRHSKHRFCFTLIPGHRQVTRVSLSEFPTATISKISAVTVQGRMLLHSIETVDDIRTIHISASSLAKVLPVRLIDDFTKQMQGPLHNSFNAIVTDGAEIGPGFVLIAAENDYILKQFAPKTTPLNLQYLSFKFVYSSSTTSEHTLGLVHMPENDNDSVLMCNYEFPSGKHMETVVPDFSFQKKNPQASNMHGHGIIVYGPMILHRIELVMDEQAKLNILSSVGLFGDNQYDAIFMQKYRYLRNALQLISIPQTFRVELNRDNKFSDAMRQMTVESFRMDLDVFYLFETPTQTKPYRLDAFMQNMYHAISSPELGMFEGTTLNRNMLRIVSDTNVHSDKIEQYRFVGRLIGMAILSQKIQMTALVNVFCNIVLDVPALPAHKAAFGYTINPGIQTMTAQYTENVTNELVTIDLVPNGQNILVTDQNRQEYISAYNKWYLNRRIGAQGNALRDGLYDVIPKTLLEGFSADELRRIWTGE